MKFALISLDQVWEDKKANQEKCLEYIEKASSLKADLVIFPEMTLTGFSMNTGLIAEIQSQSGTIDFFTGQSKQKGISIAFGMVLRKDISPVCSGKPFM